MSVGVIEDYKLRDLRASHTLLPLLQSRDFNQTTTLFVFQTEDPICSWFSARKFMQYRHSANSCWQENIGDAEACHKFPYATAANSVRAATGTIW